MIHNDKQRRAMFANMFSNKSKNNVDNIMPVFRKGHYDKNTLQDSLYDRKDEVQGFTGASLDVFPIIDASSGKVLDIRPSVIDYDGKLVGLEPETIILAGKDYKSKIFNESELQNMSPGELSSWIRGYTNYDREKNRPIYSSKPKDKMTALELAKQTYENLLENPNMTYDESLKASKGYLRELADTRDGSVRKWANKELDYIYHDQRTEYEEMRAEERAEETDTNDFLRSNRFSYAPLYAASDIPLMGVDIVGTAGAATVSLVPLVTTLGGLYVAADLTMKGTDKLKKQYKKEKKKRASFSDDPLMDYYNQMKKKEISGETVKGQQLIVDDSRVKDFSPDNESKKENIRKYSTIV